MMMTTGGCEYDGKTEIAPVYLKETADAVRDALTKGITSFVVSGVFSPMRSSQEVQAEQIIKEVCHSCGSIFCVYRKRTHADTSGSADDPPDCMVLSCGLRLNIVCRRTHPWQIPAACHLASLYAGSAYDMDAAIKHSPYSVCLQSMFKAHIIISLRGGLLLSWCCAEASVSKTAPACQRAAPEI